MVEGELSDVISPEWHHVDVLVVSTNSVAIFPPRCDLNVNCLKYSR
jgi:hypothetical protein